jgi:hypothetical protein
MNRRQSLAAFAAAAGLLALVACDTFSLTYRYRITVEVDTPEGLRTGASVIEVRMADHRLHPPGAGASSKGFSGEAVAIDLPGGQTAFALLKGEPDAQFGPENFADAAFQNQVDGLVGKLTDKNRLEWWRTMVRQTNIVELPRTVISPIPPPHLVPAYPLFVTFADIRDPKTVVRVDPDNLAASFGAGVTLKRITIQITDDTVTTGIEKRFDWWENYRNRHFDGTSTVSQDLTTDALAASLSSGSFSTEFNK